MTGIRTSSIILNGQTVTAGSSGFLFNGALISGAGGTSAPSAASFGLSINAQGQTIVTGLKGCFQPGINMTILGWNIVAYTTGSVVVDINKASQASFPVFSSIIATGTGFPTLTSGNKVYSISTSGWNTTLLPSDYLEFVVKGCTGISKFNINISGTRT